MSLLADTLESHREEILLRWTEALGKDPSAHRSCFLGDLVSWLREGRPSSEQTHGRPRTPPGVPLDAVVREYNVLREVLLDVVEAQDLQVPLKELRQLTRFVAMAIDEAIAEDLRSREPRWLVSLFQQLPIVIGILQGPEFILEVMNAKACEVWGRPRELLEGKPLLEALPELKDQGFEALLVGVRSTGVPYVGTETEIPIRRPDGVLEKRYFNFTYAPWPEGQAALPGLLVVAMEVTEMVLARRAVQAERSRAERSRAAVLEALHAQPLIAVNYQRGPEHVFEMANPVYQQIMGRDLLGLPVMRAFQELEAEPLRKMLDGAFQEGKTAIFQEQPYALRAADGTLQERVFDFVLQPVLDAEGQVEGLLNLLVDVTEHVRLRQEAQRLAEEARAHRDAEARLRARAEGERARLNALFTQAPVCIGIVRGEQVIIELANPWLCRIWGRTQAQVVGKPLLQALPELEGLGFDDLLREVMATGVPFAATDMAVQFARGKDGALETGYFTFTYEAMRDEQGRIEGALIIATEVTEAVRARQEVEALLRRSQQAEQARSAILEALSTQSLVAVSYLRGPEFVYDTANSVYRQLVDREVQGLSVREALPEVVGQHGFPARLKQVFETGEPYLARELPVELARREGGALRKGFFDLVYQPVRATDGTVDGILTLLMEVTDQLKLREEAQRKAQEEGARSDFEQHLIGIVSHDLRTPLSAISLGLQMLLRREDLDARTLQSLVRLQSSTDRAVRMVRDLLDFTQARLGGGLKIDRIPMDLHLLARGVVEEHQMTHPMREVLLDQWGEGRGEWDTDRVAQLLGNLLGNALKYSPENTPVTVRTLGEEDGVRMEVHNGGPPIPPEAMDRLFQPLQRVASGTDRVGRSVGLGLYIVERIVQAHGGTIHVTSTASEGTTFSVFLPRGS